MTLIPSAVFKAYGRKPDWLRAQLPGGEGYEETRRKVKGLDLHTVCEEAQCPNLGECWSRGTATIMILGDTCTRACGFCAVKSGRPTELDEAEPERVAESVRRLGLKHVVITSVARDELSDGGSGIWARTISLTKAAAPRTSIEVLIPDFLGKQDCWQRIFDARPDILNHNTETVPRLAPTVRSVARWDRSLALLQAAHAAGLATKSGLMLGLGETGPEVEETLKELRGAGVSIITLGQYLQPTPAHLPVAEFIHPGKFKEWKDWGLALGFRVVESGPLVRSSYHAEEQALRLAETA
ncbi:MAG TPA: lipoyl synthase [bacterium]|jgi:lipoic acid synthetase|nr:lipoyl synthase [bacterium]